MLCSTIFSGPNMKRADPELDIYYGALPNDRRDALLAIRQLVRRTWPGVSEDMTYGMPTFHLNGKLFCALASQKHFISFYVLPYDLMSAFVNELKPVDHGKGCIRFKRLDTAAYDLLDKIIKYTGHHLAMSKVTLRPNGQRRALART